MFSFGFITILHMLHIRDSAKLSFILFSKKCDLSGVPGLIKKRIE